jgi:hypothetical protein
VAVIPPHVGRAVSDWRAAGSPAQGGIVWPRQRWAQRFPSHSAMLATLPDQLSRPVVRRACSGAAAGPADAERAFLAVMAWGYGRVGYGPFRVQRMLDAAPDAGVWLQTAAGELSEGDPAAAYRVLGDHGMSRLPGLGPAFGTKFLYFCSPAGEHPALILDRLVAAWLRENTSLAVAEGRWSPRTYERYLEAMFGWADELDMAADELESCIFAEQAGLSGSQWTQAVRRPAEGRVTPAIAME